MSSQLGLFSVVRKHEVPSGWRPDEIPDLANETDVIMDMETDGLRWWDKHRLGGIAVGTLDGRSWYLPCRHRGGGNLPEDSVLRFLRGLRNKKIWNLNTRFDAHMAYADGADLEAQGCTFTDVAHHAALLDDHRTKFDLNRLGLDFVGEGKHQGLVGSSMMEYHASQVANYAKQDVRLVNLIRQKTIPLIERQDLGRVLALEDKLIPVVCEMERNGAPIDVPLLRTWVAQTENQFLKLCWEIHRLSGVRVDPTKTMDVAKLFKKLGLSTGVFTEAGAESYVDVAMKSIQHPAVVALRRARMLASLRSKYLLRYAAETRDSNVLRYALHQLKAEFGEGRGGGTVSGRFSSSGFGTKQVPDGINVQQVKTNEKTRQAYGYDADDKTHDDEICLVRRLFVPEHGKLWVSGDADQIEYRLFAHLSAAPVVLKAYADDPHANFHKIVQAMLRSIKSDFPYRRTKDINFAKVFGAGLPKIAAMMEVSIPEAKKFLDAYDAMLPEVPRLIRRAMDAAETRGFVRTLLGRRGRFPGRERLHKALNSVIQGGAADINKMKLVELHEARKTTGFKLRFTVHDEVNGDVPDKEAARMVEEILNRQIFKLKVPITWKVGVGRNWAEAK